MPENHQYRHGLAVMRAQPLHIGHEKVIRDMLAKCGKVTIILGSIQEQGTARNPFRKFVLDFLKEAFPDLEKPDVYFAGSAYDAQWFKNIFAHFEIIDRTDYCFPYVSGSMVRDMITIGDRRWKDFVNPCNHAAVEAYINNQDKGMI